MSEPFDVLLIDPGEAELVAALTRASLDDASEIVVRKRWGTQFGEVARHAEGQMAITSARSPGRTSHVLLAWWSDHCGGKHVRIRGGDKVNLRTHLSRLDQDERPPLWQVYPERIYRVKRGDAEPRWLASCACGVTGTPREVGWMGPRCGPCHDRREEGDFGAVSEGRTILREGNKVDALAFAPDGRAVAAVIDKTVLVHLGLDGTEWTLYGNEAETRRFDEGLGPLTFSTSGGWIAAGDSETGQVILLEPRPPSVYWEPEPVTALSIDEDRSQGIVDLTFGPTGDLLAACDSSRHGRLFRWSSGLYAEVRSFRGATAVAISNDGQRIAVGGSGGAIRLYSTDSGAKIGQILVGARSEESVLFLAWTTGDDSLTILTGQDFIPLERGDQLLRRWNVSRRRETHCSEFRNPSLLAMSPDGHYLASVHHDQQHSPSAIHFWDLVAWRDIGWIEWDPEDTVHALAFSPDNETLGIGTHHGRIKLVPWRQLLVG